MAALPKFSSLRRYLQGAGVEFKYAYIAAGVDNSPNVGTRTLVPGLLDDSVVVAVEDVTTPADLQSQWAPEQFASTTINDEVANAGQVITTLTHQVTRLRFVNPGAASADLSIVVDKNASNQARITVNLATNSGSSLTSTASQIRAALLQDKEASKLVTDVLVSGDSGAGVATALTEMTIGTDPDSHTSDAIAGYVNKQGASYGSLEVVSTADVNGNNDNDIYLEAAALGDQSDITFEMVDPGTTTALSVAVASRGITVTLGYAGGAISSTAADVVKLLRANTAVSALVRAAVAPTYGGKGDGLVKAFGVPYGTALSAGNGAGIVLDGDNDQVAIKVSWYDRRNAGENEHARGV
jgi:hypothetical protein